MLPQMHISPAGIARASQSVANSSTLPAAIAPPVGSIPVT
jgi:hypothetical protein